MGVAQAHTGEEWPQGIRSGIDGEQFHLIGVRPLKACMSKV